VVGGKAVRCECFVVQAERSKLGPFFCGNINRETALWEARAKNVILDGSLVQLRPHVAGVFLRLDHSRKTYISFDAYRLIEIFLSKDDEFETTTQLIDRDLAVILLGFADPPNRYLPELVMQAIARRDLMSLPTWVVLGIERSRVAGKYGAQLAAVLDSFQKVRVA
jgi:hypothetical protein